MLTISRLVAHRLRTVFSRAVGRSARLAPVLFRSDGESLTMGVRGTDVAVECRIDCSQPVESFAAPLDLLKRCEGTKDEPVSLERRDRDVEARWTDAGVPQAMAMAAGETFDLPPMPDRMEANDPRLITALRDAADSTDDRSTRYALACIQLRGNGGRIAATDANQLLVQEGFRFPWDGDALVPGNPVFACRDLHDESVSIGRTDEWATVRAGDWTIHLRITKDARFPNIDLIIPRADSATSVLTIDPHDGEFLLDRLPKLPAGAELEKPVTVDLNGHVAIRGKGETDAHATELRLTNSRLESRPILVQTNREFLGRAIKLGLHEVRLFEPNSTVLCRDEQRSLVWMLLTSEGAVPASPDAVRVESPRSDQATTEPPVTPTKAARRQLRSRAATAEQPEPVPTPTPENGVPSRNGHRPQNGHNLQTSHSLQNGHRMRNQHDELQNGHTATNGSTETARSTVETLVALRDTLKAAVGQANDAIRALKRQKREDRLLRSTLASLRQLQTLDV